MSMKVFCVHVCDFFALPCKLQEAAQSWQQAEQPKAAQKA